MQYLLDTNILSGLLRNPSGSIAKRIRYHGIDSVCTSIIVASELRFGALKSASINLAKEIEELFKRLNVVPFEAPADMHYAEIRRDLERYGMPVGGNDIFIAAHALALDCTLVTGNEREFKRVKSLRVENWLR